MGSLLYLVELPGKNAGPLVVSCDGMSLSGGCVLFWRRMERAPETCIAAFAPGRWVSVKLGAPKPPAPKPQENTRG